MINLVRNALRHNAPDSPNVTINIHSQANKIYIDVIDYGEGISKVIYLNYLNHFLVPKLMELV